MHALVSLFCFLNAVGLCKKREAELCELEEACEVAMAKLAHSPVRVPPARLNAFRRWRRRVISSRSAYSTVSKGKAICASSVVWRRSIISHAMSLLFLAAADSSCALHLLLSLPPVLSDQSVVSRNWSLMVVWFDSSVGQPSGQLFLSVMRSQPRRSGCTKMYVYYFNHPKKHFTYWPRTRCFDRVSYCGLDMRIDKINLLSAEMPLPWHVPGSRYSASRHYS